MSEKWDHDDNKAMLPWLLRGIYEMKGGVIGRTVLMTKVVEYIKMKNYWGHEKELEKYLQINAGDSYRHNLYRTTRWMIDQGLLRSHRGFNEVSITRQGIEMISRYFPDL